MSSANLLEEKQLDFNQPLLSVRKFASEFPTKERENRREANPLIVVAPQYKSDLKSGPLSIPGAVPFVWEQSPGRPKDGDESEYVVLEHPQADRQVPPASLANEVQRAFEKRRNGIAAVQPYVVGRDGLSRRAETLVSDSDADIFVDALATPSRSDSFFLNCSISGLSELDGPDGEPFGSNTMDSQTRDFMIGRFLPAAEAMTSESPQFSSRKPPIVRKQFSSLSTSSADVPPTCASATDRMQNMQTNGSIMHDVHGLEGQDSDGDEDDDDDDDDIHPNPSSKACGLLPRLCFQSSLYLLNPVPGSKHHSTLLRSTKRRSNGHKQSIDRLRQRCHGAASYRKASNLLFNRNKNGSSEISEECNNSDKNDSASCRDSVTSFRDLLAMEKLEWELDSANSVVEKTVYIDSVNAVEGQSVRSISTEFEQDHIGSKEIAETCSVDSLHPEVKPLSIDEMAVVSKSSDSGHSSSQSVSETHESQIEFMPEVTLPVMNPELETVAKDSSDSFLDGCSGEIKRMTVKSSEEHDSDKKLSCEPDGLTPALAPPLPKSPSESWLQRTLPAVSLKSSSSRSAGAFGRVPASRPSK